MPKVTCLCCDGEDFYLDNGFYYCKECQTQTQDLQEQEHDAVRDTTISINKIKRTKGAEKKTEDSQITSWECYNYILLGLVNELIELGAEETLKPIIQTLWFTYLRKIEVLHKRPSKVPNLPAYNSKRDALILYGRKDKIVAKRKRRRTASMSSASSTDTLSNREQTRIKRAMAVAAYDGSTKDSDSSLMNTTLGSLQSSTDSKQKDNFLKFTKKATQELLGKMSKNHLRQHKEDVNTSMNCHKLTYRQTSSSYKRGVEVMNQSKLYALIYAGLLINKSQIQLGDMLRFINEGHLSYNYYKHFFPEEHEDQKSFLNLFSSTKTLKHEYVRTLSGKLISSLNLDETIPMQNLVELCERYMKELNLPNELLEYCLNLIAITKPKLPFKKSLVPNYEGRVMSIIIFVLKLFFGLDDVTEHKFSNLAELLSDDYASKFNICEWLKFLLYRKLIIAKHHFPTGFVNKQDRNVKIYVNFMKDYYFKYDLEKQEDVDYEVIDRLLFGNGKEPTTSQQFAHSLTPLSDYINALKDNKCLDYNDYSSEKLMKSFKEDSVDFLVSPETFLSHHTNVFNAGANTNVNIVSAKHANKKSDSKMELVNCTLTTSKKTTVTTSKQTQESKETQKVCNSNGLEVKMEKYDKINQYCFDRNKLMPNKCTYLEEYPDHYKPESKFWINTVTDMKNYSKQEFDAFFKSLPSNFRLVFNECSQIICQDVQDLFMEYVIVEKYLCFHHFHRPNADIDETKLFTNQKFTLKYPNALW